MWQGILKVLPEYEIFLMNLRIVLKYTDCCNLKLKATLCVYVLLCRSLAPLVETTREKILLQ